MKSKQVIRATLIFILSIASWHVQAQDNTMASSRQLSSITNNYWKDLLKLNPLTATSSGVNDYNDQLEIDIGQPYFDQTIIFDSRYLDSLKTIKSVTLGEQDLLVECYMVLSGQALS
jgi:hypothetical protein